MKTKKKSIPNDVLLVFAGLIGGVVYMISNMNGIRSSLDVYLLLVPVLCMFGIPMCISVLVHYRNKEKMEEEINES